MIVFFEEKNGFLKTKVLKDFTYRKIPIFYIFLAFLDCRPRNKSVLKINLTFNFHPETHFQQKIFIFILHFQYVISATKQPILKIKYLDKNVNCSVTMTYLTLVM